MPKQKISEEDVKLLKQRYDKARTSYAMAQDMMNNMKKELEKLGLKPKDVAVEIKRLEDELVVLNKKLDTLTDKVNECLDEIQ